MSLRTALALVLAASAARASSISNEVGANSTQATDSNPRSGSLSDTLSGTIDLGEQWTLNLGGSFTAEGRTPAAERGAFGSSGNAVSLFDAGVDWDASDHVTLGLSGKFSPQSTQYAGTQITLLSGAVANALVESQSSERGATLELSYDTAGESDLEWAVSGSVSVNSLEVHQRVTRVRTATGVATAQQIVDACAARPKTCPRALLATLTDTPFTLDSQRLSAAVTATAWRDTDFTIGGDYYLYPQDPTQVGFFSVATSGRTTVLGGNGVPIAPLHWVLRPEVTHRFGNFSARIWVQGGRYAPGAGQTTAGSGLRLQYKFTRSFRMWTTASGQRDVDQTGSTVSSGGLTLGAGYWF